MPVFGQQYYARPRSTYAGSPVDEVRALNAKAAEQYQLAKRDKDSLDVLYNNLDVEDRAIPIKQRAIAGLKNKFAEVAANGNYQDANSTIAEAKKSFLTDNELQGALESSAMKKQYVGDMQERLKKGYAGEKGGITQDQYNYGIIKSEQANTKPIQYDPNTLKVNNKFSGVNVSDDLSAQIQDDVMKTVQDWKDTSVYYKPDGKAYKVARVTPTEMILENGEHVSNSEVSDAAKQYVLNKKEYAQYLAQERDIDKFHRTYDPQTKSYRKLNNNDLATLHDQEKLDLYRGANDDQIKQLEASKNMIDQHRLKLIKEREAKFSLDNPEVVNDIYDKFATEQQFNKIVSPAAEKASFEKFKVSQFTDQAAVEALKDHYAKLKAAREAGPLPPMIETQDELKNFTGEDFATIKSNLPNLEQKYLAAKDMFSKTAANDPMKATRERELFEAENNFNAAKTDIDGFYKEVTPETKNLVANSISKKIQTSQLDQGLLKISLPNLIEAAKSNKDYEALRTFYYIQSHINDAEEKKKGLVDQAIEEVDAYGNPRQQTSNDNFSLKELNPQVINKFSQIITSNPEKYGDISGFKNEISSGLRKQFNEQNLTQATNSYQIPDLGIKENSPVANNAIVTGRSILAKSGNVMTTSGEPLNNVISGKTENKFWKSVVKDGKTVYVQDRPDINKSYLSSAPGSRDGRAWGTVTWNDSDGLPLIMSADKPEEGGDGNDAGKRAVTYVYTPNSRAMETKYLEDAKYARAQGDEQSAQKLEAFAHFGSYANKLRGGQSVDKITVDLGNNKKLVVGTVKKDDNTSILVNKTGTPSTNPNYGKPLFPDSRAAFTGSDAPLILYQIALASQ